MKNVSIRRGFTIVELLVVIVVIGILAAVSIVSYVGVKEKAIVSTLSAELSAVSRKIDLYYAENSSYPIDIFDCPNPSNENICLNASDIEFNYSINNPVKPQKYLLVAKKDGISYGVTESLAPFENSQVVASGGEVIDVDGFRIHKFTNSDNLIITSGGYVEYLIVAGGGGGQSSIGGSTSTGSGGGGAGGYIAGFANITPSINPVVVGLGGTNANDLTSQGGDSSFNSMIAIGGGRGGGRWSVVAGSGGSGGGSGYTNFATPGLGVDGQGFGGGASVSAANFGGGGGGGAVSQGLSGNTTRAGNGGLGFMSDISGVMTGYCGGGGGGIGYGVSGLNGTASHGGGNGGYNGVSGQDALPNTGGGGGGSPSTNSSTGIGGLGGSGVVIVRYAI